MGLYRHKSTQDNTPTQTKDLCYTEVVSLSQHHDWVKQPNPAGPEPAPGRAVMLSCRNWALDQTSRTQSPEPMGEEEGVGRNIARKGGEERR